MNNEVELLAPVGCENNFMAATNNGANAVYLGLSEFSARRNAGNFTLEKFEYFVAYAHVLGVKVYVAVNTLIKESELNEFFSLIEKTANCGADAFIVQDVFLGRTLKKIFPSIELHLSTQAGVCNEDGAKLALSHGFKRVILARETPFSEIEKICKIAETEVFVHGALCTCFSGHCYFSSFIGGNSGNRGLCRQPCRKIYKYEGTEIKDEYRYALSLSDLNLSKKINDLIKIGVKSFKIEGRMRSFEYVSAACDFYSELLSGVYNYEKAEYLKRTYNRGNYTEGLCFGQKNDFISDKIQNHCGSVVGTIVSVNGKYLNVAFNKYKPRPDDCYKIIFNKKECGNAVAVAEKDTLKQKKAMFCDDLSVSITYRGFAAPGATLNITKDTAVIEKYETINKKTIPIDVKLIAKKSENLFLELNGQRFNSNYVVQEALNCATTKGEVKENLRKTNNYPFSVTPRADIDENIFIRKKALNELRAKAYEEYFFCFAKKQKNHYSINDFNNFYGTRNFTDASRTKNETAVLLCDKYPIELFKDLKFVPTCVIYCPSDYSDRKTRDVFLSNVEKHSDNIKTFLYVPAFYSSLDEKLIADFAEPFFGLYLEGSCGIYLSKRLNKQIFGGVELNITNSISESEIINENVYDYSVSKELTYGEAAKLYGFKLCLGDIKVMSLSYCPFGKKCSTCKRKNNFCLVDENNRRFKVRRYKLSSCRFEIFNESELKSKKRFDKEIFDFSASTQSQICTMLQDYFCLDSNDDPNRPITRKNENIKYTVGNFVEGMK